MFEEDLPLPESGPNSLHTALDDLQAESLVS